MGRLANFAWDCKFRRLAIRFDPRADFRLALIYCFAFHKFKFIHSRPVSLYTASWSYSRARMPLHKVLSAVLIRLSAVLANQSFQSSRIAFKRLRQGVDRARSGARTVIIPGP